MKPVTLPILWALLLLTAGCISPSAPEANVEKDSVRATISMDHPFLAMTFPLAPCENSCPTFQMELTKVPLHEAPKYRFSGAAIFNTTTGKGYHHSGNVQIGTTAASATIGVHVLGQEAGQEVGNPGIPIGSYESGSGVTMTVGSLFNFSKQIEEQFGEVMDQGLLYTVQNIPTYEIRVAGPTGSVIYKGSNEQQFSFHDHELTQVVGANAGASAAVAINESLSIGDAQALTVLAYYPTNTIGLPPSGISTHAAWKIPHHEWRDVDLVSQGIFVGPGNVLLELDGKATLQSGAPTVFGFSLPL